MGYAIFYDQNDDHHYTTGLSTVQGIITQLNVEIIAEVMLGCKETHFERKRKKFSVGSTF